MGVRVAKFIADSGVASRRAAEELIAAGRVSINGAIINSPVNFVGDNDTVEIDGKKISARMDTELYMFHKPSHHDNNTRHAGRKNNLRLPCGRI